MNTLIVDNLITDKECDALIKTFDSNEHFADPYRDVFKMGIDKESPHFKFLLDKLNEQSYKINKSTLDWYQIVKWPEGSKQPLHLDDRFGGQALSGILYLNDNFEGGNTYYENDIIIIPKKKRGIFFDGCYYRHGVKKVSKGTRYVIASWYRI